MASILNSSLSLGEKEVPNRVVFQPMEGCDCETDGRPSEHTQNKYRHAAKSGAGLVWFEASAVCPEGRTNIRQMVLTESNLPAFQDLLAEMRAIAKTEHGITPLFILQLTHSGRQSIVPMVACRHPIYDAKRGVTDEHIVTDEYLETLPEIYAAAANLAIEAGFDGVDVKSCHGYLFQEFLSAFSRPGKYGGSLENRARLYLDCVKAVRKTLCGGALLATRLSVADMVPKPWGFGTDEENNIDFTEPDRLIGGLIAAGVSILNVTLGNPYHNPHINRPFRTGGYAPPEPPEAGLARFVVVEKHIKEKFPSLSVVGSGLSYYRKDLMEKSEELLSGGICDLVGFGRMTLAYPAFYRDFKNGEFDAKKCCIACSKCTELMRHGCISGCAVFHPYYKALYEENVPWKK